LEEFGEVVGKFEGVFSIFGNFTGFQIMTILHIESEDDFSQKFE
jgi:hypothetical protein